jgi:sporulation related protein
MSEVSKQRLAIDLDEIERHLKQSSPAPARDPLSELAHIVGQEDPFRALLADPAPGRPSAGGDEAPSGYDSFRDGMRSPGTLAAHPDAGSDLYDPLIVEGADEYDDEAASYAAEPRRSRKGLVAVGAVLGVAVIGVAGAMAFRGAGGSIGGEPPIIQADRSPLKVQPPNPGGVEIANQDRQVLEHDGDRQTKVVSREEQPVDVRQAPRVASAGGDLIPAGLAHPSSTSSMGPHTAAAAIGIEPKKVRTVSVRPDGTIGAPDGAARSAPPSAILATMAAGGPMTTSATVAPTPRVRPGAQPTATPAASEAPRATTGAAESATTSAVKPTMRPQQVDSATPLTAVAALAEPVSPPAASTGGAFSVQLTTSGSEGEGRTAFKALQQKFAGELGSRSPVIRKHEADGKTVYRVRVGPMSKDEANSLCSRLKTAGGACFVAGG